MLQAMLYTAAKGPANSSGTCKEGWFDGKGCSGIEFSSSTIMSNDANLVPVFAEAQKSCLPYTITGELFSTMYLHFVSSIHNFVLLHKFCCHPSHFSLSESYGLRFSSAKLIKYLLLAASFFEGGKSTFQFGLQLLHRRLLMTIIAFQVMFVYAIKMNVML
ncbi:hypothetical protein Dsin_027629 [Dipteronia sinensis]|uniref:Uncharacterized protein n=1 Tax=Dipteronia sinensis TaxID=43782 RepID=A0AAD9ZNV4_9ROSI|nr:hypothetical protein Dsin_027629 [Dipteronia sinensis]